MHSLQTLQGIEQRQINRNRGALIMENIKNQILDFVRDHWEHFGAYPMEVETEEEFLTWDQYWSYITEEELEKWVAEKR